MQSPLLTLDSYTAGIHTEAPSWGLVSMEVLLEQYHLSSFALKQAEAKLTAQHGGTGHCNMGQPTSIVANPVWLNIFAARSS